MTQKSCRVFSSQGQIGEDQLADEDGGAGEDGDGQQALAAESEQKRRRKADRRADDAAGGGENRREGHRRKRRIWDVVQKRADIPVRDFAPDQRQRQHADQIRDRRHYGDVEQNINSHGDPPPAPQACPRGGRAVPRRPPQAG